MASDPTGRARAMLDALASLSDEQLAQVADGIGGPSGALLRGLLEARHAPQPEQAVVRLMSGLGGADVQDLQARVRTLSQGMLDVPTIPGDGAGLDFDPAQRAALAEAGWQVRAQVQDPALAELLDRGLALLDADGPLGRAAAGAAEVQRAQDTLREVAGSLLRDPQSPVAAGALPASLSALREQRDRLRGIQQELGQVGALLDGMAELARQAGRPADVARLAVARAELLERLDAPSAQVDAALDAALGAAVDAQDLALARRVGRRVQLRAANGGALQPVADVADRIAALARSTGDLTVEVGALGEAAVALSQLPGGEDAARARSAAALHAAEGSDRSAVRAQARLVQGQVLEKLGDLAGARGAFRQLMRDAVQDPSFPYELGWAALHLGRLERDAGQLSRGRQDLSLAAAVGGKARDWLLYALSCRALFELAQQAGDDGLARKVLADLDQDGAAIGGAEASALRRELGARLAT